MKRYEPHNRNELQEWARRQHMGPSVARQLDKNYNCVSAHRLTNGVDIVGAVWEDRPDLFDDISWAQMVDAYYRPTPSDPQKRVLDEG